MGQVCGSVCGRPQELLDRLPPATSASTPPDDAFLLNLYETNLENVVAAEKSKRDIATDATTDESKPQAPEELAPGTRTDSGKSEVTARSIDEEQKEISAMKQLLGRVSDQRASKGLLEEERFTVLEEVEEVRKASKKLEAALEGTLTPSLSITAKQSEGPLLPCPISQPQSPGLSDPDQEPEVGHGESQNNVHSSLAPRDKVRQARSRQLSQSSS